MAAVWVPSFVLAFAVATMPGVVSGGVKVTSQSPAVDGRLDEACWRKAEWSSGFQAKLSATEKAIRNQTAFAIVSDRQNIYIGLKCDESDVESARKEPLESLWRMNQVNLFLAPSGNGFNFYQFVTDGYMEGKIGGIVSHWNEILPVEIPSNTGLANMLITPLGDLIRLLPGITDDIAVYFAEGVGQALVIGSISFVAVAVPVALLLVGREKAL